MSITATYSVAHTTNSVPGWFERLTVHLALIVQPMAKAWLTPHRPDGYQAHRSRGVFREQNETLAHLQKLNAFFNVVRLFCGICTGFCLVEIKAPSTHDFDPFVAVEQRGEDKTVSLTQLRDERVGK